MRDLILALFFFVLSGYAQTLNNVSGVIDFSAAPNGTKPNQAGSSLPANCTTQRTFWRTSDATFWGCTATDTWTQFAPLPITDAQLSTSDVTTNNVTTSKHGFVKKLDNDSTHFYNGQGNYTAPASSVSAAQPYLYDSTNYFGPIVQSVKPTDTTWLNQGTATRTITNGSVYLQKPNITGHDDIACRVVTIPGAPVSYTLTVGYSLTVLSPGSGGTGGYAAVANSGSGKVSIAGHLSLASYSSLVAHVTTLTSNFTAIVANAGSVIYHAPVWVRIQDNGTNLLYSFSNDGINFIQYFSEANTAFMSRADQAGFCIMNESATTDSGMSVFHMAVTLP